MAMKVQREIENAVLGLLFLVLVVPSFAFVGAAVICAFKGCH